MHTINFVLKAVFTVAVVGFSTLSLAHNGEDHRVKSTTATLPMDHSQMKHAEMKQGEMDHSQHSAQAHEQHAQVNYSEHMNHQRVQSENTQQKDSTEKSKNKNVQKGDQHAQH